MLALFAVVGYDRCAARSLKLQAPDKPEGAAARSVLVGEGAELRTLGHQDGTSAEVRACTSQQMTGS